METICNVVIGDNSQAYFADVEKDGMSKYAEHLGTKYRIVLDFLRNGDGQMEYVASEHTVADIKTTNLVLQKFLALEDLLWSW